MKINDKHLSAFAVGTSPADKQGFLLKLEENRSLQKRWFLLKGNLLFFFEKPADREPLGVIVLQNCTVRPVESEEAYMFELAFDGFESKNYVFGATTQQEMETWMRLLTISNYEHMKRLVDVLQKQLDDLNLLKSPGRVFPADSASSNAPAFGDYFEIKAPNLVKQNASHFDRSIASCDRNVVSDVGSVAFNDVGLAAFNDGGFEFDSLRLHECRPSRNFEVHPRNFEEMHHDFGENIKKTLQKF